jgi:hypothetical protein
MTNIEILETRFYKPEVTDWFIPVLECMQLARADEREGKWIPITGEDSLPKDNEALCLFVEWNDGNIIRAYLGKYKDVKLYELPSINYHYTHYTIITPPNQ